MTIRTFNKNLCLIIGKAVCADSNIINIHSDDFYLEWLPDEIFDNVLYNVKVHERGCFEYNQYLIPCCFIDEIIENKENSD